MLFFFSIIKVSNIFSPSELIKIQRKLNAWHLLVIQHGLLIIILIIMICLIYNIFNCAWYIPAIENVTCECRQFGKDKKPTEIIHVLQKRYKQSNFHCATRNVHSYIEKYTIYSQTSITFFSITFPFRKKNISERPRHSVSGGIYRTFGGAPFDEWPREVFHWANRKSNTNSNIETNEKYCS